MVRGIWDTHILRFRWQNRRTGTERFTSDDVEMNPD